MNAVDPVVSGHDRPGRVRRADGKFKGAQVNLAQRANRYLGCAFRLGEVKEKTSKILTRHAHALVK